jgi:hypothetical protein
VVGGSHPKVGLLAGSHNSRVDVFGPIFQRSSVVWELIIPEGIYNIVQMFICAVEKVFMPIRQ